MNIRDHIMSQPLTQVPPGLEDRTLDGPHGPQVAPADPVLQLIIRTAQEAVAAAGAALDAAQGALATAQAYAERQSGVAVATRAPECPSCGERSVIDVTGFGELDGVKRLLCGECSHNWSEDGGG